MPDAVSGAVPDVDRVDLLCIDVVNSETTVGVFEAGQLRRRWRVSTDTNRTADEWGLLLTGLLDKTGVEGAPAGVCVSSTVPAALHELRGMLASTFDRATTVLVGPGVRSGVPVLMDNPREVGTDRVANVVGALDLVGAPCLVVALGTATTFDVVNGAGQYVGGAIAPGVEVSLAALVARGAQLRQVELQRPRVVIARNTIEAMQSGAVYGFAGLVDGVVRRMTAELGAPVNEVPVVVTGRADNPVVAECASCTHVEPDLTLRGLALIFQRNAH